MPQEFWTQAQTPGFHRSDPGTGPNMTNKKPNNGGVRERRFNWCSMVISWEEERYAFQPIFLVQTFASGLNGCKNWGQGKMRCIIIKQSCHGFVRSS
jgi:hypothetical protein